MLKVKAKSPVKYKEDPRTIGEVFEIDEKTYEEHKNLFEVIEQATETSLTQKTVPELKEMAKEANIEGFSKMNKDELIAALNGSNEGDSNGQSGNSEE